MWMTPKMGIRSPSEWEDPFWTSDYNRMTDLDDWLLANAEDKNQIVVGELTYDDGTETLSWSELYVVNPRQTGLVAISAGSITPFGDGWFAYVVVPRPYQAATLTMSAGAPPLTDADVVPIAYRSGTTVYLKGSGPIGASAGGYRSEELQYTDNTNMVIGPLAYEPSFPSELGLVPYGALEQRYTLDYTVREVTGGSAPGIYACISSASTAPGGGSFVGGSNPTTGITGIISAGDLVRVEYNKD